MPLLSELRRETTLESQTLYNLALEKTRRNNFHDALTHLIEAIRIAPTNPFYRSYFGYCLAQAEGDLDRALRFCRQAYESRPMEPQLLVNLGRVHRLRGENSEAHRSFVRAWEVCRGHPAAAAELTRMGIRRPSILPFLSRSHWCNRCLGRVRATIERRLLGRRAS